MTTKAIVLARGAGTRMRAADAAAALTDEQRRAADAGLKVMMPIGGRSFLDYVLSALADAGFRDVGLVIGPEQEEIRRYYESVRVPARVRVTFLIQREPLGTANAVLAAEHWAGDDPFVVLNADNLYAVSTLRALGELNEPGLPVYAMDDLVATSNIAPSRLETFALVELDAEGYLKRIVEKPDPAARAAIGPLALVSMNCWRLDRRIFDACREVPKSPRGEFELPEAVGRAAERGVQFRGVAAPGPVLDVSSRADVAEVARRLERVRANP